MMSKITPPQSISFADQAILWFQRTLLLWLVLTSWLALVWTKWFPGSIDPFHRDVFTDNHLNIAIAVTMLAVGLLLPRDEVQQVVRRWPKVLLAHAKKTTKIKTFESGYRRRGGSGGAFPAR